MLSTKVHWCVDGTFRSVPHLYLQLFTIHAFEGDKLIPLIYCLLSAKTRVIYSELFRALKDNAGNLNVVLAPELVTCDFESGLIKSIRLEFPNACVRGCYFHFFQAIFRKVQVLGLSQLYVHDGPHQIYIRKLLALDFVLIELISLTFQGLRNDGAVELQTLFDYFEHYWIEVVDHKLWNMYGVQRRTNNNLEGWHLRLNRSVGKAHANIYEFVSKLIREQGCTETLLAQVAAGNIKPHSNNLKYKNINVKIKHLTDDYTLGERILTNF